MAAAVSDELETLVRGARARVLHLISMIAAVLVAISVSIIRAASERTDVPGVLSWSIICGIFVVLIALWYRARARAGDRLREAIHRGLPVTRLSLTHVKLFGFLLPLGTEVDMIVVHEGDIAIHLAIGFWSSKSAERLVRLLEPNVAAASNLPPLRAISRAPHPLTKNLPRAVVVPSAPRDERRSS
ncbi:MAG: hypothetical protein AB7P03_01920 [Kofleriaceae bacterium]